MCDVRLNLVRREGKDRVEFVGKIFDVHVVLLCSIETLARLAELRKNNVRNIIVLFAVFAQQYYVHLLFQARGA
jgi:hypothetical protein